MTPGFSPDEAATIDGHLHRMDGRELPLNFVVTNIQPAPANLAGATVQSTGSRDRNDSLHAFWVNATRYIK